MMIRGLCPPIPTPFAQGEFSATRMADNIARWAELPVDGYVVLGSNGEAPLLDDAERASVVRAARAAIPSSRAMVVGTGRESTRAAIRSTKEAFDLGADAVLLGVPTYYRPAMTDDVLRGHFLRVADASPGPVLLYSVPFFTGLPIGASLFAAMLPHQRIAGIKESSGDVSSLKAIIEAARAGGREVSILVGSAKALAAGMELGASGAVLAVGCIAARACARIVSLVAGGSFEEARAGNDALMPLAAAVTVKHGIGGLKAALDLLHFNGGDPREPLPAAGPAARAEIAGLLKDMSLLT
jgi:4-hydroxy-2-oxoglutarate aldolase